MDLSMVVSLNQSITATKALIKAASEIRDFNAMANVISKLNAQVLDTQERLFALQGSLMAAQQEAFETEKQLRELREALAEKDRYTDFEIRPGAWVKRRKVTPEESAARVPGSPEPQHLFCQVCFAKGLSVSLVCSRERDFWNCPNCNYAVGL